MTQRDRILVETSRPGALHRGILLPALFAVLVLGLTVEGLRGWHIYQQTRAGRYDIGAAQSIVESKRLSAEPADLDRARSDFESADRKFASVQSSLRRDPLLQIARHLPVIGAQAEAAYALADIGRDAAAIGLDGIDAAEAFDDVRDEEGGTLPEKTMRVFARVDPQIDSIRGSLAGVDARREDIAGERLLPPLRRAVRDFDAKRERLAGFLDTYTRARAFTPEFLGFEGTRTYLVIAQNNAELLPTGGLVSVVGTVTVTDGHVDELDLRDAVQFGEDWMRRTGEYVEPPAPLRNYLLKDQSWNLAVSNWSPDFPSSARTAQRFFERGGGPPTDGVIALDVTALERLLTVTGPIYLDEFDVTVDSSNVFDLAEEHTRVPFLPGGDRKEFIAVLADQVLDHVLHPSAEQWSPLVDVLQQIGDEKDMLLYQNDPKQQALVEAWGWDGAVSYPGGDYLMLVDASVNSTKLNAILEQQAELTVQLDAAGAATNTVAIDYFNNLAPWAEGRDPQLVYKLMLGGLYGDYLRVLVPPGSRIAEVRDGEGSVGLEELSREQGLTVFGRFFTLPRDTRDRLSFTYTTPPVVERHGGGMTYRLRLQAQPGRPIPLSVRVAPPDGMRIRRLLLDGVPQHDASVPLALDLSRDHELTVELGG